MNRMIKRTVAVAATTVAVTWAGLSGVSGVAGAQTPTTTPGTIEISPGVYVLPTQLTQPTQVQGVQLARTGSDAMPMVIVGSGLAAAGTVFVLGARRRRNSTA